MVSGGILGLSGFARRILVAAFTALCLPSVAHADTRTCHQLETRLAGLSSGGGGSSTQARRYDAAIGRQQQQLQVARDQARQAGCGRFMGGGSVAFCGSINATIQRMEANLGELQRTRERLGGGGDNERERARIMASLDANGCRGNARTLPAPIEDAPRQQTVIDGRTGQRIGGNLSGNFRTMCVRTCDGYYFPVSWSVSSAAFARDQNACAAMCPGTQVELHYHRVPGEESEAMVSAVTGLPYRQMTNAFLYRRQNAATPPGCSCGATAGGGERGFEVIGGDHGNGMVQEEEPVTAAIPQPSGRPDPAEDPDTLANREGGLDAESIRRLSRPAHRTPPSTAEDGGERQVRVVGPVFLPDPEEAIDLQAPAPARAR
jgi:hypothetical protein